MEARLGEVRSERSISPLTGSGLATCRNVRGFEFDVPVKVSLETRGPSESMRDRPTQAENPKRLMSLGADAPFVLARDLDEIYDGFEPVRVGRSATSPDVQRVLFRGRENHLIMELRLSGAVAGEITALTISAE